MAKQPESQQPKVKRKVPVTIQDTLPAPPEGKPPPHRFLVEVDPPPSWLYSCLIPGDLRLSERDLVELLTGSASWLAVHPGHDEASLTHARALAALGREHEAIRELDRIIERDPKRAVAYRIRANTKVRIGEYQAAFLDYELGVYSGEKSKVATFADWSWALATCPIPEVRSGTYQAFSQPPIAGPSLAVWLAEWASEEANHESAVALISLAAACANIGTFPRAIECLRQAEALRDNYTRVIQALQAEFGQGKPHRVWALVRPPVSGDLTSLSEVPHHSPVAPGITKQEHIDLAKASISRLRSDPDAVVEILEAVNLARITRVAIGKWALASSAETLPSASQKDQVTERINQAPAPAQDQPSHLDSPPVRMVIADRVKSLRQQLGWSQEKLAEKSGLAESMISYIERCQRSPSLETLCKLSNALAVRPRQLVSQANLLSEPFKPIEAIDALNYMQERIRGLTAFSETDVSIDSLLPNVAAGHSPTVDTLVNAASVLGVKVADLLP